MITKIIKKLKFDFSQFLGTEKLFLYYWRGYGGTSSVLTSPYFAFASILTVIMYSRWLKSGWWNDPIEILPSLIGFTLSGYAIFTAFGDEKFKKMISGSENTSSGNASSPFLKANFTFVHFIFLQIVALIYALVAQASPLEPILIAINFPYTKYLENVFWCVGYLFFMYAITSAIAATFALFRIARWYDLFITDVKRKENE